MPGRNNVQNITVDILISIRDEIKVVGGEIKQLRQEMHSEIKQLRQEMHSEIKQLRQEINIRFERIEKDISDIRQSIKGWAAHFDRDAIVLSGEIEKIDKRVKRCEKKLKIAS